MLVSSLHACVGIQVNQLKSDLNQRETRPYDFNRKDTDISALQQNILDLQRQLQEQESSHCMVVNNYRSHLLAAVQVGCGVVEL